MFTDERYRQLLNTGGFISIAEGKHLFGNVGVTITDPNLKVALKECMVTPTNNANDPNGHLVIKDG